MRRLILAAMTAFLLLALLPPTSADHLNVLGECLGSDSPVGGVVEEAWEHAKSTVNSQCRFASEQADATAHFAVDTLNGACVFAVGEPCV